MTHPIVHFQPVPPPPIPSAIHFDWFPATFKECVLWKQPKMLLHCDILTQYYYIFTLPMRCCLRNRFWCVIVLSSVSIFQSNTRPLLRVCHMANTCFYIQHSWINPPCNMNYMNLDSLNWWKYLKVHSCPNIKRLDPVPRIHHFRCFRFSSGNKSLSQSFIYWATSSFIVFQSRKNHPHGCYVATELSLLLVWVFSSIDALFLHLSPGQNHNVMAGALWPRSICPDVAASAGASPATDGSN